MAHSYFQSTASNTLEANGSACVQQTRQVQRTSKPAAVRTCYCVLHQPPILLLCGQQLLLLHPRMLQQPLRHRQDARPGPAGRGARATHPQGCHQRPLPCVHMHVHSRLRRACHMCRGQAGWSHVLASRGVLGLTGGRVLGRGWRLQPWGHQTGSGWPPLGLLAVTRKIERGGSSGMCVCLNHPNHSVVRACSARRLEQPQPRIAVQPAGSAPRTPVVLLQGVGDYTPFLECVLEILEGARQCPSEPGAWRGRMGASSLKAAGPPTLRGCMDRRRVWCGPHGMILPGLTSHLSTKERSVRKRPYPR